ncbi:hypothetical protein GIB67_016090 [Kingdonia uniflora]|uniref:RNase H type-1 domain-containing protein n=1 Tax=Kingdonia uniflora TaxID=39325 RepID=A0A7J7L268_9MAGN|nr:hypothetical protein GIB67_016090 [Kingdonia uniflora]
MSWSSKGRFRPQERRWPRRRGFFLIVPEIPFPIQPPGPPTPGRDPSWLARPQRCGSTRTDDPEEAEAVAVVRGIEAALSFGLHRVLLLTDCQRLVSAFRDRMDDLSWGALTLAPDTRALASRFEDFHFEFVHRSCNYEAHYLAARGACTPDFVFSEGQEASAFVNSFMPDQ